MGADFGGRAAMGCRWGVLSFKLKFNRTPMMLHINFNFNAPFTFTRPRTNLIVSMHTHEGIKIIVLYWR
jgi:hypothetical protein